MRRIILAGILVLAPSLASAQGPSFFGYHFPGGGSASAWDGGAFTTPALGPVACVNPAYSFTGQATSGLCSEVAVVWLQAASGTTNTSKLKLSTGSARLEFYDATALDGDIIFSNDSAALSTGGVTMTQWTPTAVGFGNSTNFDRLILQPVAKGAAAFAGTFTSADLTAARTLTFPDATGDVAVIAGDGFPVRTAAQTWANRCLAFGTGVSIVNPCGLAGDITVGLDLATTPQKASGTADHSATCGDTGDPFQIGDTYQETDASEACTCTGIDTWSCLASDALTANLPVIGGGAGVAPSVGTRSGNTTAFVTTTGTQTSGDCVKIDASGNHIANGSACGGGSFTGGVVTDRTTFGSAVDAANAIDFNETAGAITAEGSGVDAFETRIVFTNPTADRTVTIPDGVNGGNFTVAAKDQNNVFTAAQTFSEGAGVTLARAFTIGNSSGAVSFVENNSVTPTLVTGSLPTGTRSMHLIEDGDNFFNFTNGPCSTGACTHPALVLHSSAQSTTEYSALQANAISSRKAKALTEAGGAENVFQITTATTQSGGGEIDYKIHATDATDYAVRAGKIRFVFVNVGGTVTATLSGADQTADGSVLISTTSKTLTYAITADVATANVFKLAINIDSDMTVSAAHIDYLVTYNGSGEVVPQ